MNEINKFFERLSRLFRYFISNSYKLNHKYQNKNQITNTDLILNTDSAEILAEKVLKVEHKLYPEVVRAFCENRIIWESGLPEIVKERKD